MKLAGKRQSIPGVQSVAKNVGTGSALAGMFGLMYGGIPGALTSAALDFAVAYPLAKGARKLAPPRQSTKTFIRTPEGKLVGAPEYSGLETAANYGGSVLSGVLGMGLTPQVEPTNMSQDQMIMHEMAQRQLINNLQVPQAVAPGTQFQMAGLEFLNQYIRPDISTMSTQLPVPERVQNLLSRTGLELGL